MSVIIISSILVLYRALILAEDPDPDPKPDQTNRIQRLEQRVRELEDLLKDTTKIRPDLHPTKKFTEHPIDVTFLNYKDRKRILITGGAGFVGSHLTDKLMLAGRVPLILPIYPKIPAFKF